MQHFYSLNKNSPIGSYKTFEPKVCSSSYFICLWIAWTTNLQQLKCSSGILFHSHHVSASHISRQLQLLSPSGFSYSAQWQQRPEKEQKKETLNFKDELVCYVTAFLRSACFRKLGTLREICGESVIIAGSWTEQNTLHLPTQRVEWMRIFLKHDFRCQ